MHHAMNLNTVLQKLASTFANKALADALGWLHHPTRKNYVFVTGSNAS